MPRRSAPCRTVILFRPLARGKQPRRLKAMLQHLGLKLEAVGHHQHQPHGFAIGLAIDFQRGNLGPDSVPGRSSRSRLRRRCRSTASARPKSRPKRDRAMPYRPRVEDFLGAGRIEHRNGAVVQGELALVRDRGTFGNVIVAGQSHCSAMFPPCPRNWHGAWHRRCGPSRAPCRTRCQRRHRRAGSGKAWKSWLPMTAASASSSLTAGHEADLVLSEEAAGSLQRQVVTAQGRSLVARDQAAGPQGPWRRGPGASARLAGGQAPGCPTYRPSRLQGRTCHRARWSESA